MKNNIVPVQKHRHIRCSFLRTHSETSTAVKGYGCTGAHEAQERTQAPLQTNLISYSSHAEAPKEWFYYPDAAHSPSPPTEGAVAHAALHVLFFTCVLHTCFPAAAQGMFWVFGSCLCLGVLSVAYRFWCFNPLWIHWGLTNNVTLCGTILQVVSELHVRPS